VQFGLQRFHPFVTMTRHFHGIALLLCNAKSWADWPDDIRATLTAAVAESTSAQWQFAAEDEIACRAALAAQRVSFIDLDDAARAAFKHAVRGVIAQQFSALPPELTALLPGAGTRRSP
jgi:TRAP-type C4-dicarboxylate transport system substrate-binding protein